MKEIDLGSPWIVPLIFELTFQIIWKYGNLTNIILFKPFKRKILFPNIFEVVKKTHSMFIDKDNLTASMKFLIVFGNEFKQS